MKDKVISITNFKKQKEILKLKNSLKALSNDIPFQIIHGDSHIHSITFNDLFYANNESKVSLALLFKKLHPTAYKKLFISIRDIEFHSLQIYKCALEEILKSQCELSEYYDKYKDYVSTILNANSLNEFKEKFYSLLIIDTPDELIVDRIIDYALRISLLADFSTKMLIEDIDDDFEFLSNNFSDVLPFINRLEVRDNSKEVHDKIMNIKEQDVREALFYLLSFHLIFSLADDIENLTLKEVFETICDEFNVEY